ncbi:tRNA modification GTPase MnmE [Posidoniimonas polymericola]|uniref:tRNA modification GTPase MnmE n=1 Tax=Posidoniimonas polymericola TaxID=2528002 RepID=A0A5C5ZD44_9BACT|nr:GTPase [Posidoniimonas polymericola]TWT85242.1 tRNA modification GTPase MnmE [Posidoniimonas polymericola]
MSVRPPTHAPTLATVQTAEGRGAVAVVWVSGPTSVSAVDACFHAANGRPLAEQPVAALRFGRWSSPTGEEVVVTRRGADVEVHCHGGTAAVRAVVRDLIEQGCVESRADAPGLSGVCRATHEAVLALRSALTERTAGVLLDQAEGALEAELRSIADGLGAGDGLERLELLAVWGELGRRLTTPWRVVLAGAPNVGKSSLTNALLGYDRAIVFDQPGTTRDVISADAAVEGWPISLSDTAGLRAADDPTEAAGVELAMRVLDQADLIVDVRDAAAPDQPSVIPGAMAGRRLVVWNKLDRAVCGTAEGGTSEGLGTVATTGRGVPELLAAIAAELVPTVPAAGRAVPVNAVQAGLLRRAADAAAGGDWGAARADVQALLAPADSEFDAS